MPANISLTGLTKRYGTSDIIPGLSADFTAGEFTVILGPSGCGKSTLLNMIAGLEPVTSGQIAIDGVAVQDKAPKDRGLAMVFQNYALYPHMNVADNIGYGLKIAKIPKAERQERIEKAAAMVDLVQHLTRRPSQLSGGQRQRVAIARAIIRQPSVMLYDEPLSNLDAKLRQSMRMQLSELHKLSGATSLFVTHDQVEAMTLADRIMILNAGRIEQFDTPDAIYHRPASMFVAGFVGAPPMNLLQPAAHLPVSAGEVLGIRPEHIATGQDGIPAEIVYREDLGAQINVLLRLEDGQTLNMVTPAGQSGSPHQQVHLQLPPEHLNRFDASTGLRK